MIKKIFNDRINWIIERSLDKNILSLNPIIAGGFPLSVFRTVSLHSEEHEWKAFKNRIVRKSNWNTSTAPFSDIDMWFFTDQDQSDFEKKFMFGSQSKESPTNWAASNWAKTYRVGNLRYQVVKTTFDSIEELLNSFDLSNSRYAWHKGFFYYAVDAEHSFKNVKLSWFKPSVSSDSEVYEKMFHSLRYFKYSKRYGLDFDQEIANFVYNTYAEIQSLSLDGKLQGQEKYINSKVLQGVNGYTSYVERNSNMVLEMRKNFSIFSIMETFKPEWLLFLLPSSDSIPEIKTLVESNFDREMIPKSIFPESFPVDIPF